MERLGNKSGFKPVEVGSEEWDTAQAIMDSLAVLTSLRPKSSMDESLIPPASLLRRLHRTLPLDPSPGWYGNLPASPTTALRDDMTVHLKSAALSAAADPSLTNHRSAPPNLPLQLRSLRDIRQTTKRQFHIRRRPTMRLTHQAKEAITRIMGLLRQLGIQVSSIRPRGIATILQAKQTLVGQPRSLLPQLPVTRRCISLPPRRITRNPNELLQTR